MRTANGQLPPTKSHKHRSWAIADFEGRDRECDALLTVKQDKVERTLLVEEQHAEGWPAGTRQFILVRHLREGEQVREGDDTEYETVVGPVQHCSCKGFWRHRHCIHVDALTAIIKCEAVNRREMVGV